MSKIFPRLLLAVLTVGLGVLTAYVVFAQNPSAPHITFPVAELNNCTSETECRAYCDKPENIDACVGFAETYGLMTADEAAKAKQFKDVAQAGGPGGCKGQSQCEAYCNDQSHMDECVSFAEKHNLMSPEDLAQAKQVSQALKQGAQLPGNCHGKTACEAYCKTPEHATECLDFASKAGFIPPDQVEQARKMMDLIKSGDAPQECLAGKDQCQQYCSESSHRDQCANFMVKAGFMKPEDATVFKKTGGKGPGGCQSKEECEAFCNAQENQQVCFQFGKDNGLIPQDQLTQIQENSDRTKNAIDTAPPEVKQCLQSTAGSDVLQEIESGTFLPSKQTGEQLGQQIQKCFEQSMPKNMQGMQGGPGTQVQQGTGGQNQPGQPGSGGEEGGMPPSAPAQFKGPGGCSDAEECAKYCSDPSHASECGYQNKLPASPASEGSLPPPSSQPPQSANPPILPQPTQGQLPSNVPSYPNGQSYPAAQPMPEQLPSNASYPGGQSYPTASPPPASGPTSFLDLFFASIARALTEGR